MKLTKIIPIAFWAALLVGWVIAAERPRATVHTENPQYPAVAKKMNIHGTVKLKIWITAEGAVRRVEYLGGHPLLAESALEAVKNWKYAPASQASETIVEIKF
jgi:TonB family protein